MLLQVRFEPLAELREAHGEVFRSERYPERLFPVTHRTEFFLLHEFGEEAVVGNEDELAGVLGVFVLSDDSYVKGADVDDFAFRRSDGDGFADAVLGNDEEERRERKDDVLEGHDDGSRGDDEVVRRRRNAVQHERERRHEEHPDADEIDDLGFPVVLDVVFGSAGIRRVDLLFVHGRFDPGFCRSENEFEENPARHYEDTGDFLAGEREDEAVNLLEHTRAINR